MQFVLALRPARSLNAPAIAPNPICSTKDCLLASARAIYLINPIVFANIDDPTTKASSSPRFALDYVWGEIDIADVILFSLVDHAETSSHVIRHQAQLTYQLMLTVKTRLCPT